MRELIERLYREQTLAPGELRTSARVPGGRPRLSHAKGTCRSTKPFRKQNLYPWTY